MYKVAIFANKWHPLFKCVDVTCSEYFCTDDGFVMFLAWILNILSKQIWYSPGRPSVMCANHVYSISFTLEVPVFCSY